MAAGLQTPVHVCESNTFLERMDMLYVATVHHLSARWIDVQLAYLRRHISEPFKVYACLQGLDDHVKKFDRVIPAVGSHPGKLNLLAREVTLDADPDDIIMFLDGDAFPIRDPMPTIKRALERHEAVAVQRREMAGDVQPHPCFCAMRVSTWDRIRGDWTDGHPWTTSDGRLVSDVGGNLLRQFQLHSATWEPLLRTNHHSLHPLWFGIYGEVIYHHGAGFRGRVSRLDWRDAPRSWPVPPVAVAREVVKLANEIRARYWRKRLVDRMSALSDAVYARLVVDPDFHLALDGLAPAS
jgi:hypothetical protein